MGYPEWGSTGILIIGTKNLLVKDNYIYGTDNGIAVTEDIRNGNPPVYDTVIENNLIEKCSRKGIYIRGNVDNTLIIYNTIINNPNWGLLEQHYLNYYNTGDPCNTKIYYNKFCNNGIDIESTNAEHHPNCKHCTLDSRGNRGCAGELPINKILDVLQKNFQKAHGSGANASVFDS